MSDFKKMSLDELTEFKQGIKQQVGELRKQAAEASEAQAKLIHAQHVEEATRQIHRLAEISGRGFKEEARYQLTDQAVRENGGDEGKRMQARLVLFGTTKETEE